VFVGVQWPSVVLVFPWEKGVRIASDDAEAEFQKRALAWVCEELEKTGVGPERVTILARKESLNQAEQRELAGLLCMAIGGGTAEISGDGIPTEDDLMVAAGAFQKASVPPTTGEFGFASDGGPAGAQAAGFLSTLDPRNLVRTATVYMMKDRAGIIGSKAANPLITELTNAVGNVRVVGHSYGARVMLAALATARLKRKVRSALLLQPAVNQYCFAEAGQIPGMGGEGGFRPALNQVAIPIYVTLSSKDFPLHDAFHLALRRGKDLGEAEIAAGAPPSKFCALGGYGPQGVSAASAHFLAIADSGTYPYKSTARVVALDGSEDRINSHGDVANRYTFWALSEQDRRSV
jgi:pimeloyl-ACP methyl ester carboxylesterase